MLFHYETDVSFGRSLHISPDCMHTWLMVTIHQNTPQHSLFPCLVCIHQYSQYRVHIQLAAYCIQIKQFTMYSFCIDKSARHAYNHAWWVCWTIGKKRHLLWNNNTYYSILVLVLFFCIRLHMIVIHLFVSVTKLRCSQCVLLLWYGGKMLKNNDNFKSVTYVLRILQWEIKRSQERGMNSFNSWKICPLVGKISITSCENGLQSKSF